MKYIIFGDQFYDAKRILAAEKATIDRLVEQGARSSRVKLAIQKLQDNKAILDRSLESRRNLYKIGALTTLSYAEKVVTELNTIVQQAMTAALNYIESCSIAANDPLENIETPEVSGFGSSELSKDDENSFHPLEKFNANGTRDKGLKLLKEPN